MRRNPRLLGSEPQFLGTFVTYRSAKVIKIMEVATFFDTSLLLFFDNTPLCQG